MSISNAVPIESRSKVVGYQLTTGDFGTTSPNLPQRLLIIGEANEANQSGLDTDLVEITSEAQAGDLYGYGSPLHMAVRILKPVNGIGVGGIPIVCGAQAKAGGAVAKVDEITVTGTATANATHTVRVCGREVLDGDSYSFVVATGDTATAVATKITDAINAVLRSPVTATSALGVVTCTAKWAGLTSNDIQIEVSTNDVDAGMTYAVANNTAGAGTPAVTSTLNKIGSTWFTGVLNTYGTETTVMGELETFNGKPSTTNPTGQYFGTIMRPFIAYTGSVADDPSSITDARKTELTIAICPAPNSKGHPLEAGANMARLHLRQAQENPHLDVSGQVYPDMPFPTDGDIGSMATYANRDLFLKKGCSTVEAFDGEYKITDFATTWHPTGEEPSQFRYVRSLVQDFNVKYSYYLLEQLYVVDKAIAGDDDITRVSDVIKPKIWTGIVYELANDLSKRSIITDPDFMQESIQVALNTTNPDRLETSFNYKRSGFARIASTTAKAGFSFGAL